jgi:hypothetical protein
MEMIEIPSSPRVANTTEIVPFTSLPIALYRPYFAKG